MKYCRILVFFLAGLFVVSTSSAKAYSVLTHQAVVDSAWKKGIQPLLLRKFPKATAEDLKKARASAYGGSIIQDLGYYPFGNAFFTDLVHYVRTADFITSLIRNASTVEDYAFALGALAHYCSDNNGHPIGVNPSVPLIYPKLSKYGKSVTYAESRSAHLKTEFGFDVLQVARGNYVAENYHDFIGFDVSKDLLERSFQETYCIPLKDVFTSLDLALGTYRKSVSVLIPEATKIAWQTKKSDILKKNPGIAEDKVIYRLARQDYEKDWGRQYERPGVGSRIVSILVHVLPRVGPLRALSFRVPTPEAEKNFAASFEASVDCYMDLLEKLRSGGFKLEEKDFDTGKPIRAGEYVLCDQTYAKLLSKLDHRKYQDVSPSLQRNILAFYQHLEAPIATKKNKSEWRKTIQRISDLKRIPIKN